MEMRRDGRRCCRKEGGFEEKLDILTCILHRSPPSALFPSSRGQWRITLETFLPQPEALGEALAGSSAGRDTWYLPEPWLLMSEFNYSAGVEL